MKLHVFNPEHDIALAAGLENFTAPHAGRQLRHDLGFLPALWAEEGDCVLVEDVELAQASLRRMAVAARKYLKVTVGNSPCTISNKHIADVDGVEPWGWDAALRGRLRRLGVADRLLPGDEQLRLIRELSHRRTAAQLLQRLAGDGWRTNMGLCPCEVPMECHSAEEVKDALARHPHAVMKAPWSSSGRGLRFVRSIAFSGAPSPAQGARSSSPAPLGARSSSPAPLADGDVRAPSVEGWVRGVLARQGSVMVEPYYNKVKDFGMEFEACADGSVKCCGLSLFHTANGAYTGNIVATEHRKREMMSRYLSQELLDELGEHICQHLEDLLQGRYQGPLGVDMMVVNNNQEGFLLHPCVEINLRRTMGHVALALAPEDDDLVGVMRITYANGCYKLGIERVTNNQ